MFERHKIGVSITSEAQSAANRMQGFRGQAEAEP